MIDGMKSFGAYFLLLALGVYSVNAAPQAGLLQCLYDGTTYSMVLVVYIKDDPVTIMYATNPAGVKDNNCKSGAGEYIEKFGTGSDAYWKVVVKRATGTFTTEDCGAQQPDATKAVFNWKFATRQKEQADYATLMFNGDMNYQASCDFDTLQENLVYSADITVTGDTLNTLSVTEEQVSFQVLKADGSAEVLTSVLGESIMLKVTLTPSVDGATGVSPYNCKACDASDCSGTAPYTLTSSDGCYVTLQHVATGGSPSFTGTTATSVSTTSFINFVFSGSVKKVWFICNIEFCYGTTVGKCLDRCSNKRRRRRETSDKNVTATASFTIDIGQKDGKDVSKQKNHRGSDLDDTADVCDVHVVFLAVTLSLAVLLVVSILLSIRMYCLLDKTRATSTKI